MKKVLDNVEVANRIRPAICLLLGETENQTLASERGIEIELTPGVKKTIIPLGTGFLFAQDIVLTCNHVADAQDITPCMAWFYSVEGTEKGLHARNMKVVAKDEKNDLAQLKLEKQPPSEHKPLEIAPNHPKEGLDILLGGFPYFSTKELGTEKYPVIPLFRPVFMSGIIASSMPLPVFDEKGQLVGHADSLLINVPAYPGLSGAPIVSRYDGTVLGMAAANYKRTKQITNLSYAIPARILRKFVDGSP